MQRGRAARDRAGMGRADVSSELALKRGNLRTLRYPTGEYDLTRGLGFCFLEDRLGDRDHDATFCRAGTVKCRSIRHQSTRSRKPSSSGIAARKLSKRSA